MVALADIIFRQNDDPAARTRKLNELKGYVGGAVAWGSITGTLSTQADLQAALDAKQVVLVSGTNIKTVNGSSLLGAGNLAVGTVTSVGGTGTVNGLTLSGTVTSAGNLTLSGTLTVSGADFGSQTANRFLAAPDGLAGTPTFRAIVAADVPTLNQNTTGSAAKLTTARSITASSDISWTVNFDGSANVSAAATIANSAVTLAKMADVATSTVFYRKTAGTGAPEVQTLTTLKTDLGLTGTNSGDQTITLTSDVTGSGTGSFATTIANNAVSNAKLADMATATFKGRTTAGTGDPEDLTATQATAMLNVFTSSLKGLVPSSGGGTTTFLRADGTFAVPAGDSTNVLMFGDGSDGDVTISGSVTLTRDMYYNNLTIAAGAALNPSGYRIFVKGTLDLTAAPANGISVSGGNATNAVNTSTGGGGGTNPNANNINVQTTLAAGNAGQTGAGTAGTTGSAINYLGGDGGNGGQGGTGASGSGGSAGVSGSANTLTNRTIAWGPFAATAFGPTSFALIGGGGNTGKAGSGGGDTTNRGGACGGNGGSAGVIFIAAAIISRGGSTAAGCISAKGGNGGNGFKPTVGNVGGAGGAPGGGGGWIIIVAGSLTGSSAANAIDVTGGNGAAGTDGNGTGTGGDGGSSGGGGRVDLFDLGSNTYTKLATVAKVAGGAHSGITGGTSATATTSRLAL